MSHCQCGNNIEGIPQYDHVSIHSHPELIEKLIDSFYVNDVVTGASTEGEAFQLFTDAKKILRDGAFNLRKFRTNSLNSRSMLLKPRQRTYETSRVLVWKRHTLM